MMMLNNTRRRLSPINGNQQSHLLQPTNYFIQNPHHDPLAITRAHNQSFSRLSTMSSPPIQTRSLPQPIQDQNPISVERNFHHFSPIDHYNEFSHPAATRPSSSSRNSHNNNNNASYLPAIYQRRSITTGRRRNMENFMSLDQFINMMSHEVISMNLTRELEVDHEAGLSEGEIMMSVERLTHCRSFFMSEHEGEACCICQEDYNHGEDICKLRVNHIYHFNCIKTWLMQKNLCPICKAHAMYFDDIQPSNQTDPHVQHAAP